MNWDDRATKEKLLTKGFVSIGEINGYECLAKKLEDEGGFAYHLIGRNGRAIHQFAQTSNVNDVSTLNFIVDSLFK